MELTARMALILRNYYVRESRNQTIQKEGRERPNYSKRSAYRNGQLSNLRRGKTYDFCNLFNVFSFGNKHVMDQSLAVLRTAIEIFGGSNYGYKKQRNDPVASPLSDRRQRDLFHYILSNDLQSLAVESVSPPNGRDSMLPGPDRWTSILVE
ncbi:hypothetical protein CIB48_g1515 [Xylaria polymorpha]|nr:hypothetical protein CIB48_g1515 [Xylaria polymorpha]